MQLLEIGKDMFDVIEGIRPRRMARYLSDLPRGKLGVEILGQRLALDFEPGNLFRDIHRGVVLYEPKFLNLGFKIGDRLFKVEKSVLHRLVAKGKEQALYPKA